LGRNPEISLGEKAAGRGRVARVEKWGKMQQEVGLKMIERKGKCEE